MPAPPGPEAVFSILTYLSIATSFAGGIALFRLDGRAADRVLAAVTSAMVGLYVSGFALFTASGMRPYHVPILTSRYLGEVYGFIIDPMSALVGLVVAVAGAAFLIYSIDYMSPGNRFHPVREGKGRFYGWMLVFVGATLSFIHSSTLLEMLMFFEVMSVACWGVVSYYGTPASRRSAFKALVYTHLGAAIGLYTAVGLCLLNLHTTALASLGSLAAPLKLYVFVLILVAAAAKSAQFPFYSWLPDAMVAPTPASAFLHGAAMVEMGVFLLARYVQFASPLPPQTYTALLAFLIPTTAVCVAMYPVQKDAKRLLAYSTIGESMVMYAGLAYAVLGSRAGLQASVLQLFNHAYVKGLAFLVAGAFGYVLGTHSLERLKGFGRSSPLLAAAWGVALFGLAGIPPMGIFFGKLLIVSSMPDPAPAYLAPALILLIDSCVFFMVGIKCVQNLLRGGPPEGLGGSAGVPPLMKGAIVALILLSVLATLVSLPLIRYVGFAGVSGS